MKIYAVSDIHGHCTELKEALQKAGFDKNDKSHMLVCLGDYFDRGTENFEVMKFLERIDNKVMLLGNHEDMLNEILVKGKLKQHNFINGTDLTIADFFGKNSIDAFGEIDFSGRYRDLDRLEDFLSDMKSFYETKHYIFTHGWLPIDFSGGLHIKENFREASGEAWKKARWIKWTEMYGICPLISGKNLVCGHVPVQYAYRISHTRNHENSDIFFGEGMTAIDGGVFMNGKINVLVIEDDII